MQATVALRIRSPRRAPFLPTFRAPPLGPAPMKPKGGCLVAKRKPAKQRPSSPGAKRALMKEARVWQMHREFIAECEAGFFDGFQRADRKQGKPFVPTVAFREHLETQHALPVGADATAVRKFARKLIRKGELRLDRYLELQENVKPPTASASPIEQK